LWAAFLKILQHGLSHGGDQREKCLSAALRLPHSKSFFSPIDIIQTQHQHFTSTQPIRCQQEQNRIVAESCGTAVAARRTKQGFDLFLRKRPRNVIELVKNGTRDSLGEIPRDKLLCAQIAKEAAQTARYAVPGGATE
jgi:hypothetical protein